MHRSLLNKFVWLIFSILFISSFSLVHAESSASVATIDRLQLVTQQINLLDNRLKQAKLELNQLQNNETYSTFELDKASKNLLDKAALDNSVYKSNLASINIELIDSQQTSSWLEKNIQEIENQLNITNIFGAKISAYEAFTIQELQSDLSYQKKLLELEKNRIDRLEELQTTVKAILQLKKDNYNHLNALLKSRSMVSVKQQQIKDELAFQEQQNYWLQKVNSLYARLNKLDPAQSKDAYAALEREIFYSNENANYAYVQSLLARYKDQLQQMRLGILKSNSITLLNSINNQTQLLNKQIARLDDILQLRMKLLEKHIASLSQRKAHVPEFQIYIQRLTALNEKYESSADALSKLTDEVGTFRKGLDQELQDELSARQGFPTFSIKSLLDIGKEMLSVPALTFQVLKSLSTNLVKSFHATHFVGWMIFASAQLFSLMLFGFLFASLNSLLTRPSQWKDKLNSKWLSLQWLKRNFIDLVVICNLMATLMFFAVPVQNYIFIAYLSMSWLIFKGILTVLRICLIETTHDTTGHDVRLFRRLRWVIWTGGMIVSLTVFVHQLPLIYEFKTLCDRLFLLCLMVGSLFLLRSWDVVPNLILSHSQSQHPYLQKSVRLVGIIVPVLIFANSILGLAGFMNLVMTVAWYEGIFLLVLIGYLVFRGLMSDGLEQISRLVIQHTNNGWLWTEAFLKPLDKVLRITLFLSAWIVLFLLYGWDKQSPIVTRLTGLLHYQLVHVLNTTITPINIVELFVVISIFYWTAKWIREFVYRILVSRTTDMGIRNSIAILSQYSVVVLGLFISLRVLGIDMQALAVVAGMFAFGVGLGLRDLANNFACGFLILLERPLRVGDIVSISGAEGEVTNIGGRAITVITWDNTELLVPNAEIFNKSFINLTAKDSIVRTVFHVKIRRSDNPHEVKAIIQSVLVAHKDLLKDPAPEVLLKEMTDTLIDFEVRYFVNVRKIRSRFSVMSSVLMAIWDEFTLHGIKPPHPQQEILLRSDSGLPVTIGTEASLPDASVPSLKPI